MSFEPAIYGVAAVAGFQAALRFVPNDILFGKANDVVFGLILVGAGLYLKVPAVTAFGVGATIEGLMVLAGL